MKKPIQARTALVVALILAGAVAFLPLGFMPYKYVYAFYAGWAGAIFFVLFQHRLPSNKISKLLSLTLVPCAFCYWLGYREEVRRAEELVEKYLGHSFSSFANVTSFNSTGWLDSFFEVGMNLRGTPSLDDFEPVEPCNLLNSQFFKFETDAIELARGKVKPGIFKKVWPGKDNSYALILVVINPEKTKAYFSRGPFGSSREEWDSFGKMTVSKLEDGGIAEKGCSDSKPGILRWYRPNGKLRTSFQREGSPVGQLFYDPSGNLYEGKAPVDPLNKKFDGYYTMVGGRMNGPFEIRNKANGKIVQKGVYVDNILQSK